MPRTQYKLSVDEHKNNICAGINYLQQNNEFVDMTIAADGHLVKVHQFLMAISSPYLKELIKSVGCPHPVIFLNKVSYESLCAILQYIYTGEVVVTYENMKDLLEAAKSLHIVGLESMEIKDHEVMTILKKESQPVRDSLNLTCQLQNSGDTTTEKNVKNIANTCELYTHNIDDDTFDDDQCFDGPLDTRDDICQKPTQKKVISMQEVKNVFCFFVSMPCNSHKIAAFELNNTKEVAKVLPSFEDKHTLSLKAANMVFYFRCLCVTFGTNDRVTLFYGLSNRGAIQLICNRFMYFPAYSYKNKSLRRWRCVDNIDKSCPAFIVTKDGMVVQRMKAHNHPFHDNRILKKTQRGQIFATMQEAQENTSPDKTNKSKES